MAFVRKRTPTAKTWSVIYDYENERGEIKKKWESGFKTKALANQRKAEIEAAQAAKQFIAPNTLTVRELFERVKSVYGARHWEPKTYETNEGLIRNHIVSIIGDMPIQKVTPLDIEMMFLELEKKPIMSGKGDNKRTLSSTTLRLIYIALNQGFELAVEWKLLNDNPVKMKAPERVTKEATIWTPDIMQAALAEMKTKHDQLYYAAHTTYVCAMRIGETIGLQWSKVDFENELITIDKTLQRVNKSTLEELASTEDIFVFPSSAEEIKSVLILKNPKTKGSKRTIQMPPALKHDLMMRKQQVAKQKLFIGKDYQDHDLVFCLEDGRPVEPKLCEKWFIKFQKRSEAGYPKITFHEIRHSIATLLVVLSNGNPAAVQKFTGHANPEVLLRVYNHATKGMVNELAQKFESIFYAGELPEEVQAMSTLPKSQINAFVHMFDNNLDIMPPVSIKQQAAPRQSFEVEQTIMTALERDPGLRERMLAMLTMQTTQTIQK